MVNIQVVKVHLGDEICNDECECGTLVSINADRYAYAHGFHLGPDLMVIKLTAKCNPLFTCNSSSLPIILTLITLYMELIYNPF